MQNLPTPATSFIGRARDAAALHQLLATHRLVTLTGPGGCGKTRLALHVAHQSLSRFPDGVFWCDFVAVADPAFVPHTLAALLNLDTATSRPMQELLTEQLQPKQTLIVLDNCEHLLFECARLAHALLAACPQLCLIATSLRPLGLGQECQFTVQPLETPPLASGVDAATVLERLRESEAVRLFVERAQQVVPTFALTADNVEAVATICQQLDGMPLALELAAARVKLLTPQQIASRLNDSFRLLSRAASTGPGRHQSLRMAMDWSYQFLSEGEQTLLNRLSIFSGSFSLELAEQVCNEGLDELDVLDLLAELVDKSLVSRLPEDEQGAARYRLLETVRQYAREKLEATGSANAMRNRLLEWAIRFAEEAEEGLRGPARGQWLERLEREHDNLRAALRGVRVCRVPAQGLRLANALGRFWYRRGYTAEGRAWLEEFLALHAEVEGPPPQPNNSQPWASYYAASFAWRQNDFSAAVTHAEASLAQFRVRNDNAGATNPLAILSLVAYEQRNFERAIALSLEGLELARTSANQEAVAVCLNNLGFMAIEIGDYRRADTWLSESVAIARTVGDRLANKLHSLGNLALVRGQFARAQALLEECLTLAQRDGDTAVLADAWRDLGEVRHNLGPPAAAAEAFHTSLQLYQQRGEWAKLAFVQMSLGNLARSQGDLATATGYFQQAMEQFQVSKHEWGIVHALNALGLVAMARQQFEEARSLFQTSLRAARQANHLPGQVFALEQLAHAEMELGHMEQAARMLASTAAWRAAQGIALPLVDAPRYAAYEQRLLASDIMVANLSSAAISAVVAEVLHEEVSAAPAEAAAPPVLELRLLGQMQVLVHGQEVPASAWVYAKARELLAYLACHPPASKARINLDLWPEAAGESFRNAFHKAAYHMRQALGHPEWLVFHKGTYAINPEIACWCDLQTFERTLAEVQPLLQNGLPQPPARGQAIAMLQAATRLWRGDLLEDLDGGDWALFRRETMRQQLLHALLHLGQLTMADADYTAAIEVYQRVLSLDNFLEMAHRELMRCYARQGEASQALRHYQQLARLLRDELDTEPSTETSSLYERLRRGDDV
ncbi:MAG: tetratricopeptide repeat protein [Chloroflexaceae bacterium]|nr:tetratricopeptide repeat protein [Chloroflexaceae bacterium]